MDPDTVKIGAIYELIKFNHHIDGCLVRVEKRTPTGWLVVAIESTNLSSLMRVDARNLRKIWKRAQRPALIERSIR